MEDVQHSDGGSGSHDHDRCQIESKAEQHQHGSRAHAPQDRMKHDPVTEPARQTAHLLPHPSLGLPTTVGPTSSGCRATTGGRSRSQDHSPETAPRQIARPGACSRPRGWVGYRRTTRSDVPVTPTAVRRPPSAEGPQDVRKPSTASTAPNAWPLECGPMRGRRASQVRRTQRGVRLVTHEPEPATSRTLERIAENDLVLARWASIAWSRCGPLHDGLSDHLATMAETRPDLRQAVPEDASSLAWVHICADVPSLAQDGDLGADVADCASE